MDKSFSKRLRGILDVLSARAVDIAGCAGIDSTNISHFLGGRRIPGADGPISKKLVEGIVLYARKHDRTRDLCEYVGIAYENLSPTAGNGDLGVTSAVAGSTTGNDSNCFGDDAGVAGVLEGFTDTLVISDSELIGAVFTFLFSGITTEKKKIKERNLSAKHMFGEHLDISMKIADVTNVWLAKKLNLDASLVSRYRSGIRMPRRGVKTTTDMVQILFSRIEKMDRLARLAEVMSVPDSELTEKRYYSWLFDYDMVERKEDLGVEGLLSTFDDFIPSRGIELPPVEAMIPAEISDATDTIYYGNEGLRRATLRFLTGVILRHYNELWLYSDQDMEWMTEDADYMKKWAMLMMHCVKNGTTINIVHNINRSVAEMNSAIRGWLPLYMSGKIRPHYFDSHVDRRFSHTIFLCPGYACISGFNTTSGGSVYRFDMDPRITEASKSQIKPLFDMTPQLISFSKKPIRPAFTDECNIIKNSMTLHTMPKEMVEELGCPEVLPIWKEYHAWFLQMLDKGYVYEFLYPFSEEDVAVGKVRLNINEIGYTAVYNEEMYKRHYDHIMSLAEQYPHYNVFTLPEKTFYNINIMISDSVVNIAHFLTPDFSFVFTEPMMCRAFLNYARSLRGDSQSL